MRRFTVTSHRQEARFKLVTAGEDEKVVGLHGIGYGVDEMIPGLQLLLRWGATKLILTAELLSIQQDRKICDHALTIFK